MLDYKNDAVFSIERLTLYVVLGLCSAIGMGLCLASLFIIIGKINYNLATIEEYDMVNRILLGVMTLSFLVTIVLIWNEIKKYKNNQKSECKKWEL